MKNRTKGLIFVCKVICVLSFVLTPAISKAQDLPCDGLDPYDTNCPLDTWVILLVAVAGVFAAFHLYRKQKNLQA